MKKGKEAMNWLKLEGVLPLKTIVSVLLASIFDTCLAIALNLWDKKNKSIINNATSAFRRFFANKGITFVFALLFYLSLVFAIPQTFNIQGKLTDSNGAVLSGNYNMTFRIYDNYTSGDIIWQSLNQSVSTDLNGIYNVILYNINTTFGAQYYLGIEVQSDGEMSPRINLTSTPYTFRANISEDLNCSDCVDGIDLSDTITLDANMNLLGYNFSINNSDLFIDTTNARVGIGTTGPVRPLHINVGSGGVGRIQFTNQNTGTTVADGLSVGWDDDGSLSAIVWNWENGNINFGTNNDEVARFHASGGFSFGDDYAATNPGVDNVIIEGNVGIGTTAPAHKLEVAGSMNVSGDLNVSGNTLIKGNLNVTGSSYLGSVTIQSDNITTNNIKSKDGNLSFFNNSNNEVMRIVGSSGNVGIGTTNPTYKLDVAGKVNMSTLNVSGDVALAVNSGNVGIGTTSPEAKLHVAGEIRAQDPSSHGYLSVYGASGATAAEVNLGRAGSTSWHFGMDASNNFNIVETGIMERLTVKPGGNVGIGTTSPSKQMVVNGTTEGIVFDPDVASPVINTTLTASTSNLTITSSGGSVIIRLG